MPAIAIVLELLPLVPKMIAGIAGAIEAWNHGTSLAAKIDAENRTATPAEIADMRARVHAIDDAIQAG